MMGKTTAMVLVGAMLAAGCGQAPMTLAPVADRPMHTAWYGSGGFGWGGTPPASGVSDYFRSRGPTSSVTGWGGGVFDWSAYYPSAGAFPGFNSWNSFVPTVYANDAGIPFAGPYAFGASAGFPFSPWRVF